MPKREVSPHPVFEPIERHHDMYKYCHGGHPRLAELSARWDALRSELTATLNSLRDEERAAWQALEDRPQEGQGWRLVPANAECGKYYAEEYEDRDWVRFRCYREGGSREAMQAHKNYYGPVADWRTVPEKVEEGKNYSVVYFRTSSGKVKSDGGGWPVLNRDGRDTFSSDFGVWTDLEWQAFKTQGVIPQRFW